MVVLLESIQIFYVFDMIKYTIFILIIRNICYNYEKI